MLPSVRRQPWRNRTTGPFLPATMAPLFAATDTDPLRLWSGISFGTCWMLGNALVLVLFLIGRRFGWKGQAIALLLLGLGQPFLERIWFGALIPALDFSTGAAPVLGSAGMLIASASIGLLIMRLIGGPSSLSGESK